MDRRSDTEPTLDDQLARLVELHASGGLTDAEFARAKAAVLSGAPVAEDAPAAIAFGEAFSRISMGWLAVTALILGVILTGSGTVLEIEPVQLAAAPLVCSGGVLHTGYDVSYTVNTKGVEDAATCEKDGVTSDVASWLMFVVLTVVWAIPCFALLLLARMLTRRRETRLDRGEVPVRAP